MAKKIVFTFLLFLFPFSAIGEKRSECFQSGQCKESYLVNSEYVNDELECLQFCRSDPDCSWFTYFTSSSNCQLFKDCPVLDSSTCPGCLSGEKGCELPEPLCWLSGSCEGITLDSREVPSVVECLNLCKSTSGCRWFTFENHHPHPSCVMYRTCDVLDPSCTTCTSGERLCNEDSPTSATKATTTPLYPTTGGTQATTTRTTTAEQTTGTTTPIDYGEVNLVGGSNNRSGNVFAKNVDTGVYGPVCSHFFDLDDAIVVCKQLGFAHVLNVYDSSHYGQVQTPFSYHHLFCTGGEFYLSQCDHQNFEINHCFEDEGAGVECYQ